MFIYLTIRLFMNCPSGQAHDDFLFKFSAIIAFCNTKYKTIVSKSFNY